MVRRHPVLKNGPVPAGGVAGVRRRQVAAKAAAAEVAGRKRVAAAADEVRRCKMQPIIARVAGAWFQRLTLTYDQLLSKRDFNINMRRYNVERDHALRSAALKLLSSEAGRVVPASAAAYIPRASHLAPHISAAATAAAAASTAAAAAAAATASADDADAVDAAIADAVDAADASSDASDVHAPPAKAGTYAIFLGGINGGRMGRL